jgi:hypothetical protein
VVRRGSPEMPPEYSELLNSSHAPRATLARPTTTLNIM